MRTILPGSAPRRALPIGDSLETVGRSAIGSAPMLPAILTVTSSPVSRITKVTTSPMEIFFERLLELSSAATGLLVSAIVSKPDLGVTITVVLLMPQILFSGLTFELSGVTEVISWLAVARWGMEGFGTTAGLQTMGFVPKNYLDDAYPPAQVIQRLATDDFQYKMFERTPEHLITVWAILGVITAACLVLTALAMRRIRKDA